MAGRAVAVGEVLKLVDVGDDQGGVAVEDVQDPERVRALVGPDVRGAVGAEDLEPDHPAAGLRRVVGDEPEREGDAHAAASRRVAEPSSSLPARRRRRERHGWHRVAVPLPRPCSHPDPGHEGRGTAATRTEPQPWEHGIASDEGDGKSEIDRESARPVRGHWGPKPLTGRGRRHRRTGIPEVPDDAHSTVASQ